MPVGVFRRPPQRSRPRVKRWIPSFLGPIHFDAASSSGYEAALSTYSWSHTTNGTNRGLLVFVSIFASGTVTGITYNGVAMTFVRADANGVYRSEVWRLENPASGSHAVAVTLSASLTSIASALSYFGVNQTNMVEANAGTNGVGGTPSQAVTPITDLDWVVSGISTADTATSPTNGVQRANNSGALGSGVVDDVGPISPAAAKTMTWAAQGTLSSWALSVVAIAPAGSTTTVNATWSATQGQTASLVRTPSHVLAATQAEAASLVKTPAHAVAASQGQSATVSKAPGHVVSASETAAASLAKGPGKALAASETPAATIAKGPGRVLVGTDAPAGKVVASPGKNLIASEGQAATFGKGPSRTFSATSGALASWLRNPSKILLALQGQNASTVKTPAHTLSVAQGQSGTFAGSTSGQWTASVNALASIVKGPAKFLAAAQAQLGSLAKVVAHPFVTSTGTSANVNKGPGKIVAGQAGGSAVVVAGPGKKLLGVVGTAASWASTMIAMGLGTVRGSDSARGAARGGDRASANLTGGDSAPGTGGISDRRREG